MTRVTAGLLILLAAPGAAFAQAVPAPPAPPAPPQAPAAPAPPAAPELGDAVVLPEIFIDMPMDLDFPLNFQMEMEQVQRDIEQTKLAIEQGVMASQSADMARAMALAQADRVHEIVVSTRGAGGGYNQGLSALQRRDYEQAVSAFDRVISTKGDRADAAAYWKAFAQYRLGQTANALATLDSLRRTFPQSRYLSDARVLEADVKQQSGQPVDPAGIDDDEIKLLAIQGLRQSDQVVPLLQQVLTATNSLNVKRRALYVLALNDDPRARQVLLDYAKGTGTPDLQLEAIRYLASRRDQSVTTGLLREVYSSTSDASLKREVINAYITMGRGRRTGPTGAPNAQATGTPSVASDLVALYRLESDADVKRHIINALSAVGAVSEAISLVRAEKDPAVQRHVIAVIGGQPSAETTRALVGLYHEITDVATREAVLVSLASQRDAEALIALARKETNRELKTAIVRHLSGLANRSEAAAAYLAEMLQ